MPATSAASAMRGGWRSSSRPGSLGAAGVLTLGATSGSGIRASYVPVSRSYLSLWKVLTFHRDAFAGQDSLVAFLRSGVPFGHAGTLTMLLDWLDSGVRIGRFTGQTKRWSDTI